MKSTNFNTSIRGISLIVLVITIIVIIILAGAVILSLNNNNPITSAGKAVFANDVKSFQTELELYKSQKYLDTKGVYNPDSLQADYGSITYDLQVDTTKTIKDIIPTLGKNTKYDGMFTVENGKLVFYGAEPQISWAKEIGIDAKIPGEPKVTIATIGQNVIKAGSDIVFTVSMTSQTTGLSNIILTSDTVKLVKDDGSEVDPQPTINIGQVSGTSADKTRTVNITVKTTGLEEANYNLKIKAGSVINSDEVSNTSNAISASGFTIDNTPPENPNLVQSPTDWTNGSVTVTITPSNSGDTVKYNFDGGTTWTDYTAPIVVNTNGTTIYAIELDSASNQSGQATTTISRIDTTPPQNATINASVSGSTLSGTIALLDNESGIDISRSKYIITNQATAYGINDSIWASSNVFTSSTQNISQTEPNGDYYIQVLSVDKVGNARVNVSGKTTVSVVTVNAPVLANGMTPIKFDASGNIVTTTAADSSWYNYANKQWANAQTADGSMWVWIPRYEYKISTPHSSTAQTIAINFINGTSTSATNGYTIEPAFTFGSTELTGIWVAKFEATAREGVANATASDNVTSKHVKVVPGVQSWRYTYISTMFTVCRNMETDSTYGWGTSGSGIDTHLMKNIEWGAVAYLSSSQFGKTGEVTINSNSGYYTGGNSGTAYISNVAQSTTGTIYGIYDMSGGSWEYTAAYVNNGNGNLTTYGSSLVSAANEYKDIYTSSGDTQSGNYSANSGKVGDAVYETSNSYSGTTAWYGDYTYMPYSSYPFFRRGGVYGNGSNAGVFAFNVSDGNDSSSVGFRPVLAVSGAL